MAPRFVKLPVITRSPPEPGTAEIVPALVRVYDPKATSDLYVLLADWSRMVPRLSSLAASPRMALPPWSPPRTQIVYPARLSLARTTPWPAAMMVEGDLGAAVSCRTQLTR